jgi:hypothetical protein
MAARYSTGVDASLTSGIVSTSARSQSIDRDRRYGWKYLTVPHSLQSPQSRSTLRAWSVTA